MNNKRAARAAGAGFAATGVFLAALIALGGAVLVGLLNFSPGASTDVRLVVALIVVFAMIVVGGALPARALGAGWQRSLLASGVAMGPLALATPTLLSTGGELFVLFYLFAFVVPAFVAVVASVGHGLSLAGLASMVAVAALFYVVIRLIGFFLLPGLDPASAALAEGTAMVATGWALLPALAGLFQRRPDEHDS